MVGIGAGLGVDGFPLGLGTEGESVSEARVSAEQAVVDWVPDPETRVSAEQALVDWVPDPEARVSDVLLLVQYGNDALALESDGGASDTLAFGVAHTVTLGSAGSSSVSLALSVKKTIAMASAGSSTTSLAIARDRGVTLNSSGVATAALTLAVRVALILDDMAGSSDVSAELENAIGALHSSLRLAWDPVATRLAADYNIGDPTVKVVDGSAFMRTPPFEIVMGLSIYKVLARVSTDEWTVDITPTRGTPSEPHFAGGPNAATVTALPHTIEVSHFADKWDFTALALADFTTHEMNPGGEIEVTWSYWTSQPETMIPPEDARVLIKDLDGSYFSALTTIIDVVEKSDHGCLVKITAYGYVTTASDDGYEDKRTWTAFTAGHTIVSESRNEKAPLISSTNLYVIDGGQSISQDLQGIGQTPRQIWDKICSMGDIFEPLDYQVQTDDGGSPNLHLRRRIGAKIIVIPRDSLEDIGLRWDATRKKTKVVVRWRDGYVLAPLTPDSGDGRTRWLYKDYSSQIDNVDLAHQIAEQLYTQFHILNAIGGKVLNIEYPKPVYEYDSLAGPPYYGAEFPIWRIKAGWNVIIDGITPYREDLPIPLLNIVDVQRAHGNKKSIGIQLGALIDDNLDITAQYAGRATALLGGPASGVTPQFVTPPEGSNVAVNSDLTSWGASGPGGTRGNLGWKNIVDDGDIAPIWYGIDGGGEAITPGRKLEIPIDVGMQLVGFRLTCNDGQGTDTTNPGPAAIKLTIKHDIRANYPAAGALIASIEVGPTPGFVAPDVNLIDDGTTGAGKAILLKPTSDTTQTPYITVTVGAGATAQFANFALLVRRTSGSSRHISGDAPTISASASGDGHGLTTFTVTTNKLCTIQIDYGPDANFRSKTLPTTEPKLVSVITQRGVPSGTRYQAHATTVDKITVSTGVQTV